MEYVCDICNQSISDVEFTMENDHICKACLKKTTASQKVVGGLIKVVEGVIKAAKHYHAEIVFSGRPDNETELRNRVSAVMNQHTYIEEFFDLTNPIAFRKKGFWTHYRIGGKFKGAHIYDYHGDNDIMNYDSNKKCHVCNGLSTEPGSVYIETCSDCSGKGEKDIFINGALFPTLCSACGGEGEVKHGGVLCKACKGMGLVLRDSWEWPMHVHDVCHIDDVKHELTCDTLILGDVMVSGGLKVVHTNEGDEPIKVKDLIYKLQLSNDVYLVTIDYVNVKE